MNIAKIITAICTLLFFMIGADKFLAFLEPPCSLENSIPTTIWKIFGILYIISGILIWLPKFRKPIAGFFAVFMFLFTVIHLMNNTYDIGGAVSMGILLGLLAWDPRFIRGKKNHPDNNLS